jgi:hypothetical protein
MDEATHRFDLTLGDFYLIESLKKFLAGKRFAAHADVSQPSPPG